MNTTQNTIAILNKIYSWKHNSLAAYIINAGPYVKKDKQKLFKQINKISESDTIFDDKLSSLIIKLGGVPSAGVFEPTYGELNYLSINYLAKVLTNKLKTQLEQLEQDIKTITTNTSEHALVQQTLNQTLEHISYLMAD